MRSPSVGLLQAGASCDMTLRVALVDPYLGGSHLAWATGYSRSSSHLVTVLGHDARFWKWRMRGAHVTLAEAFVDAGGSDAFDVILATGMLDLAAFQGLVGGDRIPAALYMHESQLTYPVAPGERMDETYPMINWVSCLAAGEIWFNSNYHREVFLDAIPTLLRRFPDYRHGHLIDRVREKTRVIPVGVDLAGLGPSDPLPGPPRILWNHRWEHDKAPEVFVELVDRLHADGHDFRLLLCGERIGDSSDALRDLVDRHGDLIDLDGYLDDDAYRKALLDADIMVSTARQEFFGVSLTEAMAAGALPVVPDRLVYPERIPAYAVDRCLYDGIEDAVSKIASALTNELERRAISGRLADEAANFDWSQVAPTYDAVLASLKRP